MIQETIWGFQLFHLHKWEIFWAKKAYHHDYIGHTVPAWCQMNCRGKMQLENQKLVTARLAIFVTWARTTVADVQYAKAQTSKLEF